MPGLSNRLVSLVASLTSKKDTSVAAREWLMESLTTAARSGSERIHIRHQIDAEMIAIRFSQPQTSSADLSDELAKKRPVLPPLCPQMRGLPGNEFEDLEQVLMELTGVTKPYIPWGNRTVSSRDAKNRPVQSSSFKMEMDTGEVLRVTIHTSEEKGLRRIDLHVENLGVPFREN